MSLNLNDLKPLIDWLELNPILAGVATFIISLAESLAIVGLFIPGTIVMTAIGSLVGSGIVPASHIFGGAIGGAIVGDSISYWLGKYFHERIRDMWPFKHYPVLLQKGETFFTKHGGKSVFLGRFVGPVRPMIPVIAGMLNMRSSAFLAANISSAFCWAIAYMGPGVLIGAASVELAPHVATRLLVMCILLGLSVWLCYWIIKELFILINHVFEQSFIHLWQQLAQHRSLNWINHLLSDPREPDHHSQLMLLFNGCLSFFCAFWLAWDLRQSSFIAHLNSPLLHVCKTLRTDHLNAWLILPSFFTAYPVLSTLYLSTFIGLCLYRYWRLSAYWLASSIMVLLGNYLLTHAFNLVLLHTLPFPSLPLALWVSAISLLISFIYQHQPKRWLIYLGALLIVPILVVRIWLGIDMLSASLAGLLLGIASNRLISLGYRCQLTQPFPQKVLLITFLATLISWSWYSTKHYAQAVADYSLTWPNYTLNTNAWWNLQQQPREAYRSNPFGHPVQMFNIQWADTLPHITHMLTQQAWQVTPKPDFITILNRIGAKDREQQLPLFPKFYLNHKPALQMIKPLDNPKRILILRLWNAGLNLDNGLPLWLGTINYHRAWEPALLRPKQLANQYQIAALHQLQDDLVHFDWRQTLQANARCLNTFEDRDCNGSILLIKPQA